MDSVNDWHASYKSDMEMVFQAAYGQIQHYPSQFRERAEDYMNRFNPLEKESTKNYICYLLPFWVQDAASIDRTDCHKLSVANVFVMLYYFIQDDLMDSHPADWKHQLALGNLFHATYSELFRELFPSSSPFWRYHRQYVEEWSQRVASAQDRNSFEHAPASLAGKASPVKLASTGAMLLGHKEHLIAEVSELIDHVLATLQMVDDWMDWEDDLLEGSDNSFVDLVRIEQQLSMNDAVTTELVNRCIFTTDVLSRFTRYATDQHAALASYQHRFNHLLDFHLSLIHHLEDASLRISATKRSMLHGGFVHYLAKTMN